MALFENFPYTNLHELNLDWLIQEMENLKELVQDGPVISVNGQTGVVTLYQEAQVRLPDVTDAQQTYWNIFRSLNGHLYGIRFDSNGNVYAIRDGIRTKLLTWADIPPEAGVISVNGLYGVVHISGTDIPWMGGENETVFDKLSENEDAIDNLNIVLGTLTNAIKAGIAYLEPNVDDTAIHNIPAGRYVFWKNYAYKSTQAISIGDTLSSTNLQAVGDGGFINALQIEIDALNSNKANYIEIPTPSGSLTESQLCDHVFNNVPNNTLGAIATVFSGGYHQFLVYKYATGYGALLETYYGNREPLYVRYDNGIQKLDNLVLNSELSLLGTSTNLGYSSLPNSDSIETSGQLSEAITNYKYFIVGIYYSQDGSINYGCVILPTDQASNSSAVPIYLKAVNGAVMLFWFEDNYTVIKSLTRSSWSGGATLPGNNVVVYGVK